MYGSEVLSTPLIFSIEPRQCCNSGQLLTQRVRQTPSITLGMRLTQVHSAYPYFLRAMAPRHGTLVYSIKGRARADYSRVGVRLLYSWGVESLGLKAPRFSVLPFSAHLPSHYAPPHRNPCTARFEVVLRRRSLRTRLSELYINVYEYDSC